MADPSRLVLLQQLPHLQQGAKVRFLGCIHGYDMSKGLVLLRNHYPTASADTPSANVDLTEVLENITSGIIQKGSWVNVIGVVQKSSIDAIATSTASVDIHASMIWSAGAVKLDKYEAAVRAFQKPLANT